MIIKEINVGENNPFRFEHIPETEEERFELAISDLCGYLNNNRCNIFVEKDIFDKAVKHGYISSDSILLIDADSAEVDSVLDNISMTYCDPEWWSELINKSSECERVILVIDSVSASCNEHKLRCYIRLVKDRYFNFNDVPSNLSIVITGNSYDELIYKSRTMDELLSLCMLISLKHYQLRT